ncbi:MAG: hypothetical protein KKG06_08380 [Bacteroidetes bacterium]|nr:hypothetical protein [Bacteroidota bacterium]MBU1423180.1 hypothetical protein [Bacteroidota bacterium]
MKTGHTLGRDERRRIAGDHLKNADKHLKVGEIETAIEEVEKALAVDTENFYALAYKERISEAFKKKEGDSLEKQTEIDADQIAERAKKIAKEARQKSQEEARKRMLEQK